MGRDLDETDPLQPLQCFAHRRARDAQPLGQIVVAEALAGSEASVEDRLAQARVDLVTENGAAGDEGARGTDMCDQCTTADSRACIGLRTIVEAGSEAFYHTTHAHRETPSRPRRTPDISVR
nr:hypothetical protein GCM10025699_08590 [Microbacterium flavescens]